MYGIFTYIYYKHQPNVGKYTLSYVYFTLQMTHVVTGSPTTLGGITLIRVSRIVKNDNQGFDTKVAWLAKTTIIN